MKKYFSVIIAVLTMMIAMPVSAALLGVNSWSLLTPFLLQRTGTSLLPGTSGDTLGDSSNLWSGGYFNTIVASTSVGIGTSTPTTNLQVTASAANATSTLTLGKLGQNKGSCLELYDAAGTAVYAFVAAGATTFTLSATSCK